MARYRLRIGASGPPSSIPSWVEALSLWQWYEIPNTALSATPPTGPAGDYGNVSKKVTAWTGATLKREGSVYVIAMAGGHNDYFGNEANALTLNTTTPAWTEHKARSAFADLYNWSALNADLSGAANHTYQNLQFIDSRNTVVCFSNGGAGATDGRITTPPEITDVPPWIYSAPYNPGDSRQGDHRWSTSLNWGTGVWDSPGSVVPKMPLPTTWDSTVGTSTAIICAKHPITGDVYHSKGPGSTGFWRWTNSTGAWDQLSASNNVRLYAGCAIDPTRDRMLVVGDYNGTADPLVLDLTDGSTIGGITFGGDGVSGIAAGVVGNDYPGVIYDEENDTFLIFRDISPDIVGPIRVRASDWFVDVPTVTGTAPLYRENGIHNSVQYVPELKGFVLVNDYYGNAFFMRTAL